MSQTIQTYKRLTKRAETIIADPNLAGTNTKRVRWAVASKLWIRRRPSSRLTLPHG